ncbi:hypothetical protein HGRIS_013330 [Hohenbuehelia grisea]|uniref:Glycosyltransferase family 18 catalytic domain-containing protein n=1 Tax=Hohenbuehelia grisea TaxID=104357 RepID=A0ABR3IV95_9AGAR
MALMKLNRWRITLCLVCAILPTLILLQFDAPSLANSLHSFTLPFISTTDPSFGHSLGSSSSNLSSTITKPLHEEQVLQPIVNNNVTYPRILFNRTHSHYAALAQQQLARLKANESKVLSESMEWNKDQLQSLIAYLSEAEVNPDYVPPRVVLTSWHWVPCAYGGCTTGEVQWIRPLIRIMKKHKIFYLFSFWEHFVKDFKLLGDDLITHTWVDDEHLVWCFVNTEDCLRSATNPDGVPPWKLFAFTFWGSKPNSDKWLSGSEPWSFNPLGSEWNLVPYQMPEKQYFLGYHYQGCQTLRAIPYSERDNRVVVLAKLSNYYHNFPAFDPKTFYYNLQQHTGFDIISNANKEEGYPVPDGLRSVGLVPPDEYDRLLANAKALLGIGKPIISPTPYASLCRGVPVILPYNGRYVMKHNNKTCGPTPAPDDWCGFIEDTHQHGPASAIGPPYVYTVDVNAPQEEILKVIDTAIKTHIEPFEAPEMRYQVVEARVLDYFAIDWQFYAEEKLRSESNFSEIKQPLVLPDFLERWAKSHDDPSLKKSPS